jgi:hypothetical protein
MSGINLERLKALSVAVNFVKGLRPKAELQRDFLNRAWVRDGKEILSDVKAEGTNFTVTFEAWTEAAKRLGFSDEQ